MATALPAFAQDSVSTPVVQALPSQESLELSSALSRLSRDPRNVDALIDAGVAASQLGDYEASVGFFRRGQTLSPLNPRLLAGLAGAMVRRGDPAAAIPLFEQAQAAGALPQMIASDRGLAYDLIGDTASAQRHYALALAAGGDDLDEVTRRLAISQAISGDGAAMEKTLLPLLRKQDKPAWRARAFGLAMLGQAKESERIVKTLLPGRLADGIAPYLQYMPRLTAAQKAAAANLGVFPRAAEIGRDDTRIAALAPPSNVRDAGRTLVPAGRPLGPEAAGSGAARSARQQAREAEAQARREERLTRTARNERRVAPPEPRPTRDDAPATESQFSLSNEATVPKVAEILDGGQPAGPKVAAVTPPARPVPAPVAQKAPEVARSSVAAAQPNVTTAPTPAPAPVPAAAPSPAPIPAPALATVVSVPPVPSQATVAPAVAAPGFDLAQLPASSTSPNAALTSVTQAATAPAPVSAPSPAPAAVPAERSFGALFADLGKPSTAAVPAAGAVDIRKIEPVRSKPKPEPQAAKPPPPPSHPSRIWVQLGIGQRLPAMTYDWRRMEKANQDVLKGRKPYSARLNQTNRLLTGPFASQREAAKFIADLEKAGFAGPYVWTSPAGEVVDELPR